MSPIWYIRDYLSKLASLHLHKLEPRYLLHIRTKQVFSSTNLTQLEILAR